jgi:hypothetical protein
MSVITTERAREIASSWDYYTASMQPLALGEPFAVEDLLADIADVLSGLLDTADGRKARADLELLRTWAQGSQ